MVEWTIHLLRCESALLAGRPELAPRIGARTPDWLTTRTERPCDPAAVLWTLITPHRRPSRAVSTFGSRDRVGSSTGSMSWGSFRAAVRRDERPQHCRRITRPF